MAPLRESAAALAGRSHLSDDPGLAPFFAIEPRRNTPGSVVSGRTSSAPFCADRKGGDHEELRTVLPGRQGRRGVLRALDGTHPARHGAGIDAFCPASARDPAGFADPAVG